MKRIIALAVLLFGCADPTGPGSTCGWFPAGKSYFQVPGDSRTYTLETQVCGYLSAAPAGAIVARSDSTYTLTVHVVLSPDQLRRLH